MHSRMEFQYHPVRHGTGYAIERHVLNVECGTDGRPLDVRTVRRHIVATGFATAAEARRSLASTERDNG